MLIFSVSDTGLVRNNNEDYHRYDWARQIILLADGVGGHAFGEIASRVAVESAWQYLLRNETLPEDECLEADEALAECMAFANQKVLNQQRIKPAYYNMGTTLVAAWLLDKTLHYAWVGDSRLYHVKASDLQITQLTKDHTVLQENQDKGNPDPDTDISGCLITRMIGSMYNAQPGLGKLEVESGDLLLACSDGLSDMVSLEKMQECMVSHASRLSDAPMALRNLAYEAGARDNITAVVALVD
jgi:protein phosphatase